MAYELTHKTVKATLEINDRLYILAEEFDMGDDWVQETATTIQQEILAKTGVDIRDV